MSKLQLYDIALAPIRVNDYLVMEVDGHRHHLKVLAVHGEVGTGRTVQVKRISSTDPSMSKKDYEFVLQPGQPVMGVIIPEEDFSLDETSVLDDAGNVNRMIVVELAEFLQGLTHQGNKARFATCVEYLVRNNILPKRDYEKNRDHVSKVIAAHTDKFVSRGTYIHLKDGFENEPAVRRDPTQGYVEISQFHLNKALYHLLMSGLLTGGKPVKLVDTGLEPKE